MLKKIIAALSIAALSFIPTDSQAMTCHADGGVSTCFEYQYTDQDGDQVWDVVVTNRYTTEEMTIWCDGPSLVYWESEGGATADEVHTFASAFCRW